MLATTRSIALLLATLALPSVAAAQSIVPAPGEAGHDAALLERAEGWVRLQQGVLSLPLGFGLEAYVSDAAARATIESFVASGMRDFAAATGTHPYALLDHYDESGDLGMFGGVQAAGDAFRYVVLRDSGAPAAELDAARDALVRAMDGLHWQTRITGVPGVVARGIARITPEPGEPPVPGEIPSLVPLFAADGTPLPVEKTPTWRADASGELPFLIWIDDCSKDQLDGYVLALGAVYDAVVGDPAIDRALVERLVQDALAIGLRLLARVEVSSSGATADLVIVDADGRPTSFHDLSAEEILPGEVFRRPTNGFNALMGLGILRTIFHITGDALIGRFYYQELIGNRGYLEVIARTVRAMYVSTMTNYSNVNMAFVAAWGILRFETDASIRNAMRAILEEHLYAPGVDREARGLGLPFFDFMYAAFRGASDANGRRAIDEGTNTLRDMPAAPVWNPEVINCDEAELAARACTGLDGTPLAIAATAGRGGSPVALDPVPMRIRPPSNFVHRSDPHVVNGGGGTRLNPAGSMHAAYWMGRLLEASDAPDANVSPHARAALPWTRPTSPDAGTPLADAGVAPPASAGCGCRATRDTGPAPLACVLALVLVCRSRWVSRKAR